MATAKRISNVRSLSGIIPKGTEGAKEFARVIDLLLFQESRRTGRKMTLFSDSAGDYMGLDSFEGDIGAQTGITGYQYKFFPSPLTAAHRKAIKESLLIAAGHHKKGKIRLNKWVLVTADDLTQSASKKGGGDLAWFENLRTDLDTGFPIEHWGRTKIIGLFLESRSLCLYYYPQLVTDGASNKRSIQATRKKYDENLLSMYRNIDFVGMSIYKEEAVRGVPMESIYIPLKIDGEKTGSSDKGKDTDPVQLLRPGARVVILGDPGSGKSTLLKFMALCGISPALQLRYKTGASDRLPIMITLRRYADELKSRANLSLFDYIRETAQGDFSLAGFDNDFLEYWLESGKANLFFDGLDELPDSRFKQIVRDRIRALATTYPGNNIVVSSRIVGYDHPFRFEEKDFFHCKLTALKLPEMEQFVRDWYAARIDNPHDREMHINDLVRILKDDAYRSIRELSETPLLLTIVTLVHRIDAVLPDERVVLYQKCTETLLNTWYDWKSRGKETTRSGKTERRNRQRMENIAWWMQTRSTGTGPKERSVVPRDHLLAFLTGYIKDAENPNDPHKDAEDLAADFIEFIKEKAGLLIELGDRSFSFIHLTFQEYLCATYLATLGEKKGVEGVYNHLASKTGDPRWYEVIRLLVAGLRSEENQQYFIQKFLGERNAAGKSPCPLLLGGLLVDGVAAAETGAEEIVSHLVLSASAATSQAELRSLTGFVSDWIAKQRQLNEAQVVAVIGKLLNDKDFLNRSIQIRLVAIALGLGPRLQEMVASGAITSVSDPSGLGAILFPDRGIVAEDAQTQKRRLEHFNERITLFYLFSQSEYLVNVRLESINFAHNAAAAIERIFHLFLMQLATVGEKDPKIKIFDEMIRLSEPRAKSTLFFWAYESLFLLPRQLSPAIAQFDDWLKKKNIDLGSISNRQLRIAGKGAKGQTSENSLPILDTSGFLFGTGVMGTYTFLRSLFSLGTTMLGAGFSMRPSSVSASIQLLSAIFPVLEPIVLWEKAIQKEFDPRIATLLNVIVPVTATDIATGMADKHRRPYYVHIAACQLLIQAWVLHKSPKKADEYSFEGAADLTRGENDPPLRIAHCIRDIFLGDATKITQLEELFLSQDPAYKDIFTTCRWKDPDVQ